MNIQTLHATLSALDHYAKDIESLEDLKLVAMIGTGTAEGKTLCAKQILHLGAPATIRRRLDRLVKLGHVITSRSVADGRVLYLRLSSGMTKALGKTFKGCDGREAHPVQRPDGPRHSRGHQSNSGE